MTRKQLKTLGSVVSALALTLLAACGTGEEKPSSHPGELTQVPTASPRPLSSAEEWDNVPSGSLIFFSPYGDSPKLYTVNVDGTGLRQLTESPEPDPHATSADGKLIAYVARFRDDGQPDGLYVSSVDGSDERLIARDARSGEYASDPRWVTFISWSSQGKILYGQAAHQVWADYWITNPDGSDNVRISQNNGCLSPRWSPDGEQLLLCQCTWGPAISDPPCSLSILDQQGRPIRTLIDNAPDGLSAPEWSPDGSQILFIGGHNYEYEAKALSLVAANGDNLRSLFEIPPDSLWARARWFLDGSSIILTTSKQLLLVSPTDGGSRVVANGDRFLISPDESKIVTTKGSQIDVVSMADGSSRVVANVADFRGLYWSPNSDWFAYLSSDSIQNPESTLSVVSSDGVERRDLAFGLGRRAGITWSRDGEQVMFHETTEGVWWVSPDGSASGRLRKLSKEATAVATPTVEGVISACESGPDEHSCLSPDGKTEAFVSPGSKVLTTKDIASGIMSEIGIDGADVWNGLPVWSNDGTKIALHAGDHGQCELSVPEATAENSDGCKIYVVDVATGDALAIAQDARPGDYGPAIAWSPGDDYVYYVKGTVCLYGCAPGLLYRVHPDGTGEEEVADIRVDTIYGFKP